MLSPTASPSAPRIFARIGNLCVAGHNSITITQRYCHPQAEANESAFARVDTKALPEKQEMRTKAGASEN